VKRIAAGLLTAALAAQPSLLVAQDFEGTARLQLQRVNTFDGSDKGPGRSALEAQLAACNGIRRKFYELEPQQIAAGVLARVDRQRVEHYLRNGSAATYVTGTMLELPDMNRWTAEAARSTNGKVQIPPECSRYIEHEHRTGTLWRDGVVWQLDFTARRAMGARRAADFTPRPLPLPVPFESLPQELLAGQSCREVTVPVREFLTGKSCLWTAFPATRFLNLPWPLRAEIRLGMPGRMLQVDQVVLAERNGVLEPGLFDVPVGFSKVGPAP
jgi:hypothetical protein